MIDAWRYYSTCVWYKIIIPKEEPKPFKDMQQLTEVNWEKFKKKPFISKKEPKQGTMSEAIKQVVNNQLKQETLEEAAKDFIENTMKYSFNSLETKTFANRLLKCVDFGAKWQQEQYETEQALKLQEIELKWMEYFSEGYDKGIKDSERMYSEEELHNAFYNGWIYRGEDYSFPKAKKEWFEQFKNNIYGK
jgi:hypothetical protein